MAKPIEEYLWAESAEADDISDPSVERPGGYKFKQDLPNNQFNHLIRAHGRWIDWLEQNGGGYASLDEFLADATPGETALVAVDPGQAPGAQIDAAALAAGFDFVATDGLYVVASQGTNINRYSRDLATVTAVPLSQTATTIRSVRIAHGFIVVVYDTFVDVFDADTLALALAYDRGVAVHDVAITQDHIITVGAQNGSGDEVVAFETDGFTADWSFDHGSGNTVYATCTDNDLVYIGGDVGSVDSATVRALDASNGAVAWSVATPGAITANGALATNGRFVFVEGASNLQKLSRFDGAALLSTTALGAGHLETDGRFLFASDGGDLKYWDLLTMSLSDAPAVLYTQGGAVVSVDTDGERVFVAGNLNGGAGLRSLANPCLVDRRFRRGGNILGCLPSQRACWPLDQ